MAPRVKRLAGQGAQNIGAFTADKVQAANTPFQNLKLPDLNDSSTPNMLMQAGKFTQEAAGTIAQISQGIRQDQADAFLLNTGNAASDKSQTLTASYKSAPTNYNPVTGATSQNPDAAYGAKANPKWFTAKMGEWDAHETSVRDTDEYKDLNTANKLAVDAKLAASRNGFRATAMSWMVDQGNASRKTALEQTVVSKQNDIISDPVRIKSHTKALITAVENSHMNTGSAPVVIVNAARTAVGTALTTTVDNILNSSDPDRVKNAAAALRDGGTFTVHGKEVKIDGNTATDLRLKIELETSGEKSRALGNTLFDKFAGNEPGAMVELRKKSLSDADFKATKAQFQERQRMADAYKSRTDTEALDADNLSASNGEHISEARILRHTPQQQKTIRAHSLYAKELRLRPVRPTVPAKKQSWDMMEDKDLAAITEEKFLTEWLPNFNTLDGTADKIIDEYTAARNSAGVATIKLARSETARKRKEQNTEQKKSNSYFKAQSANLFGSNGALVEGGALKKAQAAMIRSVAKREFEERNSIKAMEATETDKLLKDISTSVLLKTTGVLSSDDEGQIGLAAFDITNEDGELLKGGVAISKTLATVPASDRFEMLRWFTRQSGQGNKKQIDANELDAFIVKWGASIDDIGTATISDIPADHLEAIRANMRAGTPDPDGEALKIYKQTGMSYR